MRILTRIAAAALAASLCTGLLAGCKVVDIPDDVYFRPSSSSSSSFVQDLTPVETAEAVDSRSILYYDALNGATLFVCQNPDGTDSLIYEKDGARTRLYTGDPERGVLYPLLNDAGTKAAFVHMNRSGELAQGEFILSLIHIFQYQAYLNRGRSYRDLPMRLNETSTLFRNEDSGEMHGLIRVRQFTISEGHLMCTPEQLEDEFRGCLELAIYMLQTLGLYEDVSYRFSQWDPDDRDQYVGTPAQWDEAQSAMQKILDHLEIPYKVGVGEAAFYGPKLDIQIRNVHGKEDTLITIQIDQMLAEKFGMEYTDRDGTKKNPYIIHRTSIGCYERTLALLIEKYAGAFPMWLAPVQVKVLPITDDRLEYARKVAAALEQAGLRIELDDRNEKIGYKIREAQLQKVCLLYTSRCV